MEFEFICRRCTSPLAGSAESPCTRLRQLSVSAIADLVGCVAEQQTHHFSSVHRLITEEIYLPNWGECPVELGLDEQWE